MTIRAFPTSACNIDQTTGLVRLFICNDNSARSQMAEAFLTPPFLATLTPAFRETDYARGRIQQIRD
jgi:hypothetical protein